MDWSTYMEYLQSVLKQFDNTAALIDNLLIWYFRDGLRPSIYTQLNKIDRYLDNWQTVVEQVVNPKAKAT